MKFLLLFTLLYPLGARAMPDTANLQPLFFQADRNNVQVLPQRFEYALVDEDRIKIGDILIDSTKLNFQMLPTDKGRFILRFNWPAGLLREGRIIVKNNVGKAIFTADIDKANTRVRKSAQSDAESHVRADTAEYVTKVSSELIEDMKYLPFMNFCIYREDVETRIYLCSKELYLGNMGGKTIVKSRNSSQQKASVEINTQAVGNQGIVFLNDAKEKLVFKAFSKNGASLEIQTHRKDVDFKDVVLSPDGQRLILTASGAAPVEGFKVKELGEEEWQAEVPLRRPIVYLKGEGDIPMRQEFLIKGPLPTEKDRAYLSANASSRTYSSALEFRGYLPPNVNATPADADSRLQMSSEDEFQWVTTHLASDQKTRRYLLLKGPEHQFVAGHDVFRGLPFELGGTADYSAPSGLIAANLHFSWWAENFLFVPSSLTTLHWGARVEREQHLTSKDGEPKVDLTTLELLYRFTPGFYLVDETWGLNLDYQMLKTDGASPNLMGLGLFIQKKAPQAWRPYLSWYEGKLRYFFSSSGTDFKVKQAYNLEATAYRPLSDRVFFNYGAGLSQYKYDPKAGKEAMQLHLNAGMSLQF